MNIVQELDRLKRNQGMLFDAMSLLTDREREVITAIYNNRKVIGLTNAYTNEIINNAMLKLHTYIRCVKRSG